MHLGNKNWFVTFAAAGLGLAIGASASADPIQYTWNGTGTAWNADANWNQQLNGNSDPGSGYRYPGAASRTTDIALIPNYSNDPLLNSGSVTVARLQLQSGASLAIDGASVTVEAADSDEFRVPPGGRIDIDGASGALILDGNVHSFMVGGTIAINDSGAQLRIISDTTLTPYTEPSYPFTVTVGLILGADDAAEVNVVSGAQLTSEIKVEGQMAFGDEGTFANMNYVNANVGGHVISFGADLSLDDEGAPANAWRATGEAAELAFLKEFVAHSDFVVTTGLSGDAPVHVYATVMTFGSFNGDCGFNVAAADETLFVWALESPEENYCPQ